MAQAENITFPVGRMVMGSLYKPQDKDADGKPLLTKSGPNAGQPKVQYFYAVAIAKGQEQHWSQTEWGAKIWGVGHTAFPKEAQGPHFAWKLVDGDSAIPNKKGNKPCDREGYPRHWVLSFTSGFAPKIYNRDGTQVLTDEGAVKLGYFVQVNANVVGNGSTQNPGIFLNGQLVALSAFGEEIVVGPDASAAGFGAAPLPAGAMTTPPAGFNPAPPATPPAAAPTYTAPQPAAAAMPPAPPNPAFLQVGAAPTVPAVPAAPPAPPAKQMTAKAQGATYDTFVEHGWTDALLVQHGYMVA